MPTQTPSHISDMPRHAPSLQVVSLPQSLRVNPMSLRGLDPGGDPGGSYVPQSGHLAADMQAYVAKCVAQGTRLFGRIATVDPLSDSGTISWLCRPYACTPDAPCPCRMPFGYNPFAFDQCVFQHLSQADLEEREYMRTPSGSLVPLLHQDVTFQLTADADGCHRAANITNVARAGGQLGVVPQHKYGLRPEPDYTFFCDKLDRPRCSGHISAVDSTGLTMSGLILWRCTRFEGHPELIACRNVPFEFSQCLSDRLTPLVPGEDPAPGAQVRFYLQRSGSGVRAVHITGPQGRPVPLSTREGLARWTQPVPIPPWELPDRQRHQQSS